MTLYAAIDVGYPDDPKVIDAGDLAELVYLRCVLRCRQHLTDGVIDRRVLPRWLVGIRGKHVAHMDRLVEVGLLCVHDAGWCIPLNAWKKWNPTKAEVEQKRDDEKRRKAEYRDRKRGESQRDTHGTDGDVPGVSAHVKPEPEPSLKPSSSSRRAGQLAEVDAMPDEDDPLLLAAKSRTRDAVIAGRVRDSVSGYFLAVVSDLRNGGWTPKTEPAASVACEVDDCSSGWLGVTDTGDGIPCLVCRPWAATSDPVEVPYPNDAKNGAAS